MRIAVVGASGLIGSALIRAGVGRSDVRLIAIARRELPLPPGATMEVLVADPANWGDAIAAARPDAVVSALGTTTRKVNGDQAAFRAVDHDLVIDCARWSIEAGARQFILVSSAMADPHAKNFYLRMKGETEQAVAKLGLARLDVVQPGLLLGARTEWRPAEAFSKILAPIAPLVLHGSWRRFRPFHAARLADVILALAHQKARGRFWHEFDGMVRVLRRQALDRSIGSAKAVD